MIDLQVAIDKLNGMECEEIRHFFRLEGVKGRFGSANCPIARWLQKVTGQTVLVGGATAGVVAPDRKLLELGEGPQWFIHNFDSGQYPELRNAISPRINPIC